MSTPPVILLDGTASAPPEVLGHKGHGIDMMRRNDLPVPPAFCITAEVGARYRAEPRATIDAIWDDVRDGVRTSTEPSSSSRRKPGRQAAAAWSIGSSPSSSDVLSR